MQNFQRGPSETPAGRQGFQYQPIHPMDRYTQPSQPSALPFRVGPYIPAAQSYQRPVAQQYNPLSANSHYPSASQYDVFQNQSSMYPLRSHNAPARFRDTSAVHHLSQEPTFRNVAQRRPYQSQNPHQQVYPYQQPGYHAGHVPIYPNQPPPPPPPAGGFPKPYFERPKIAPRPTSGARAKRPLAAFCEQCTKGFECEEEYDIHVAEDHVTCSHPGCGFSAREDVVRAHKVRHSVNTESKEEVDAWIAMRRFKFPRAAGPEPASKEPKTVSKLEKFIRGSIRQARIEARKQRLDREKKQPCVHWERQGRCKFADSCSFAHEKTGVCTFFANHGRCRHGIACKYKHVRVNSKEFEESRQHGGLLKKLVGVEMNKFENTMLQILRHAVNNNFYQPVVRGEAAPISQEDEEEGIFDEPSGDEDFSDSDTHQAASPISNCS